MENSSEAVDIAVNILVVAAFLSVLLFIASLGSSMYIKAANTVSSKTRNSAKEDWTHYNRNIIQGDEVRYILDKYTSVFVRVVTPTSPFGFFGNVNYNDPESAYYIDMSQDFLVFMIYDSAGNPAGLSIEQISSIDDLRDSTAYCNIVDTELVAYDNVIDQIKSLTDNMKSANGGRYAKFSTEAVEAGKKYYAEQGRLSLYQKLQEVL
ncbi:hypothetical protein AALB53_09100 [Lachnospiraceae bacterium 47-T17]